MALYDELNTGPLATELAPFVASADENAIYAVMHRNDIPVYGPVDVGQFVSWSAETGMRAKIKIHSENNSSPLQSIALALLDWIGGNAGLQFDLSKEAHQLMLQAWVTAGELTAPQRDALYTIAEKLISRAEQVSIPATILDIRKELWNDDGTRRLA